MFILFFVVLHYYFVLNECKDVMIYSILKNFPEGLPYNSMALS